MATANWLQRFSWFFSRGARRRRPAARPGRTLLKLEQLEDRALPSATLLARPVAVAEPTYQLFRSPAQSAISPFVNPAGFDPAQIRGAYGIDKIMFPGNVAGDGTGETIGIVDAFDDPTAGSDLAAFDQLYGLPAATFVKVGINALGHASTSSFPSPNLEWAVEIALDVEWAHAIAPQAKILLVEAHSNSFADLLTGVDYARNYPGVATVSMSWAGAESTADASYESHFTIPSGHGPITFFASAGDTGTPAGFPAVSDHVVAVGGTTLTVDSSGNWASESGWSAGGGGTSAYVSQPSYQDNLVIYGAAANGMRAVPDVAYNADPTTGVAILATYGYGGWLQVGGTSAGSPQWAAIVAIADQGLALAGKSALNGFTQTLPDLYNLPSTDFHDVTTGNNGLPAGPGFDLVTGLGTPIANFVVPDLVGIPQVLTSVNVTPANATLADGHQLQLWAVALDQFGKPMVPQPNLTWALTSGSGAVSSQGRYVTPVSGSGTATLTASATVNNITVSGTASVSYLPGPFITQLTGVLDPATGTTADLSAQVSDPNPGTLTCTWSVIGEPVGAPAPAITAPGSMSTTVTFFQAGAYEFYFRVVDGTSLSDSGSVSVTVNPTLTSIALSPATAALVAGVQQQLAATALDQFGNALTSQPALTWSVVGGAGTVDATGLYTAPATGSGVDTVKALADGTNVSGTVSVTYVPVFSVTIISATPNPVTGTTATVSAVAADPGSDLFYVWSVLNAPVGVAGPLFTDTAATTTATFFQSGNYTLQVSVFSSGGQMTTATVDVTVVPTLTTVLVAPLVPMLPYGAQQQFAAVALDQFFQPLNATFTWSLNGSGTLDATGLYTAPASGMDTPMVQATATVNGVTANGTAYVTFVQPPAISAIKADPNPVTGTTTTLSVVALDPGGGSLSYSWSVLAQPSGAPVPTISAANADTTTATFFQAGAYTFQVMVADTSAQMTSATVDVTVSPTLTSVVVTPSKAMVPDGASQQFTTMALDQFHQPMSQAFTWSVVSGLGVVDASGLYTAPAFGVGTAVVKAAATVGGVTVSGTASVTLIPVPAITLISGTPNPVTGTTAMLKVVAANPGGGSLAYHWSVLALPSGAPVPTLTAVNAAQTNATFFQAGSYTFRVAVTNSEGQAASAQVTVTVNAKFTYVVITPATLTIHRGLQQQFSVMALDQFHRVMANPSASWSVSWSSGTVQPWGPGSISSSGLYTAPISTKGTAIIKAKVTVNGVTLSGTATVTVT
jgi:hypothetical protein